MSDVTELRCWPSCVGAIDWSQDGIIALASDERVELLFPNTVAFDRDQDVPQWQHIPLQVPWFSGMELSIKEPAPLANYSIGEEISASAPVAIAWSPPGLAKHRRCALAALTANLVLSIWSAVGKPQEGSSWERNLIINNTLTGYFLSNATEETSHVVSSFEERMRLRTRIRAFTWAPILPNAHSSKTLGTHLSYGQHIVAVCNDDNQLALVIVHSPTSTCGAEESWNAEVMTHISIAPDTERIFSKPCFFNSMMKQQRHISNVAWSPWIIKGGEFHSVIVYSTNEDVRGRVVMYTHDSVRLSDEVLYPDIEMPYNGPMKWSPTIDDGDIFVLALFTASGLVYMKILAADASVVERTVHALDGRWDQISGAIWDSAQRPLPRLHFSSLLSTIQSPTAVLEASSNGLTALISPSWRDQIENSAVLFSVKNDLKGNSKTKVWGLAISPLGDFIATCNSVHPSDMIEYGSPNDRRGTVAVTALRQYRQIRQSFPSQDVSAEGVLFTLKKLVENTIETADHMPEFAKEIIEKLRQAFAPIDALEDSNGTSSAPLDLDNLNALVKSLKRIVFLDPHTLKDRYTILVSYACNNFGANDLPRTLIAYRLATALQSYPAVLSKMPFSAEISGHHRQIISLVQTILDSGDEHVKAPKTSRNEYSQDQTDTITDELHHNATTSMRTIPLDLAAVTADTCDFCSAPIPFADLTLAVCTNGHQFPRCGLSFLAIQAPGITKYCGICDTPFLSEEFVLAQEGRSQKNELDQEVLADKDDIALSADHIRHSHTDAIDTGQVYADEAIPIYREGHGQDQRNETRFSQVFSDVPGGMVAGEARKELFVTLARALFLACDACIYCGGKFVG